MAKRGGSGGLSPRGVVEPEVEGLALEVVLSHGDRVADALCGEPPLQRHHPPLHVEERPEDRDGREDQLDAVRGPGTVVQARNAEMAFRM